MPVFENYLLNPSVDYLDTLQGKGLLTTKSAEILLKDWARRSSADSPSQLEKILLHYEASLGIMAISLYDYVKKDYLLESGPFAHVLQRAFEKANRRGLQVNDRNDEKFAFNYEQQKFYFHGFILERRFFLCFLIPPGIQLNNIKPYIGNIVEQLVIPQYQNTHEGYIPLFYYLTRDLPKKINAAINKNQPVAVTLLTFNLSPEYIEVRGINLSRSILKEIGKVTVKSLKEEDLLVAINLRNYVIISENCVKEALIERMNELIVDIDGLVLSFDTRIVTLRKQIHKFSDVWRSLLATVPNE